jgi:TatA/E family protein of Tat protein translocase
MFGTLGGPELFLIFVVALIIFGPRKLPEIGKSLGRMMGEFRKASNEFRSTIESEVEKIRDAMRIEPPRYGGPPAAPPETPAAGGDATVTQPAVAGSPDTPPAEPTVPETVNRQPEQGEPGSADAAPVEPK